MKSLWEQIPDSCIDDYLYIVHIEKEKKRKAQKRKEWARFYFKNKAKIDKYNLEQKRSKDK